MAVTAAEVDRIRARLGDAGVGGALRVEPAGPGRALVRAVGADDTTAEHLVAALRADGWSAATRPEGGGHLRAWRDNTRPVDVSGRLSVCFPWSEIDRSISPPTVEIDPGRAFGTGAHPSTRLLLTALAARLRGGEQVLDVGCGSGVLALAAARLGAWATAVDIEPEALLVTAANAARNRLGGRVEVRATGLVGLAGPFDAIVANIGAAVLVELAPRLRALLAPSGWLGVSGISPAQTAVVAAALQPLQVAQTSRDDDWEALVVVS